jgi:dolichol-phosphate mannosyltransferase
LKTLIVIPTYNEKENLSLMVDAIFSLKIVDGTLLIIDDNSPDGTGLHADQLKRKYPRLQVLHRKAKDGLGRAYLDGFRHALQQIPFDFIVQMDADFSHDPLDVPRLIAALKESDIVIGSRHIEGATLNYPWYRKILSFLANLFARTVFRLPVKDCTAGFKAYRRKVIEKIINERYYSNAYAFQCELLFYAHRHGFRLMEIPVVFEDRKRGKSKMTFFNIIDGVLGMLKVRWRANNV